MAFTKWLSPSGFKEVSYFKTFFKKSGDVTLWGVYIFEQKKIAVSFCCGVDIVMQGAAASGTRQQMRCSSIYEENIQKIRSLWHDPKWITDLSCLEQKGHGYYFVLDDYPIDSFEGLISTAILYIIRNWILRLSNDHNVESLIINSTYYPQSRDKTAARTTRYRGVVNDAFYTL